MRQSSRRFAFFSFLMVAVGCAHAATDDEDTATASGASSFCGGYCTRLHTCDQTKDQKTCENSCANGNAATLPKLRSDIVGLISSCIDKEDCKTVLGGTVLGTCSAEAAASVAPSAQATSFCDAVAASAKKCNKSSNDTASCLTKAKLYNDAALSDAKECTQKACADVDECIDAALGSLEGTGSTSTSNTPEDAGKKDAKGTTTDPGTCPAINVTDACSSCQASECCTQATACANNSSCANIVDCAANCTDQTCIDDCESSYSSGASYFNSYLSCFSSACSTDCQ